MRQGNQWNWLLGVTVGLTLTAISSPGTLAQTASLLPNAVQYFMDGNGKPLANGKVYFYEPGGTTPKTTWTTANESVPQAQPVVLGTSGRPTNPIYGDGSYRQIVKDQFNNVIWDFNTASAGGGSTAPAFSEGVMVGTLVYWANTVLPGKYLYAAGQAISRVTYPALFTALTWNTTVLCSTGVATISVSTEISDKVPIGAPVEFSCFTPGTTVSSKVSGQLTLSTNATTTTSATGVIFPWGNGDGSTTFNVPDMRGRAPLGRDNMNGSPISRLVASVYGSNPDAMNAAGGSLSTSLGLNQVPQGITGTGAVTGTFTSSSNFIKETGGTGSAGGGGALLATLVTGSITGTASVTSNNTGKGQAASATVGAGGSGYSAGTQIISVAGGTCTVVPQFSVTIVAGAITAPVLTTAGQCTVVPSNPAATTGGGGTGGTLNVTYAPLPLGTIPPSITSDWIVKALPDDTPGGTGVTSIGGMVGAITCGAGITCTANAISASSSGTANLWPLFSTGASTPPAYRPIVGSDLPNPSVASLGAVFSSAAVTNQFITSINTDGTVSRASPVNNFNTTSTAATGGTITMTSASTGIQILTGSLGETYKLPDATTLVLGQPFLFNNNAAGNLTIKDGGGVTQYTLLYGGLVQAFVTDVSTAAGVWDFHAWVPNTASWGAFGLTLNDEYLKMLGPISTAAWTTNGVRLTQDASTLTDTTSSGTVATAYTNVFGGSAIAATNPTTFTNYYGAFFKEPTAGTNVTLTNKKALGADSLQVAGGTVLSGGLTVQTGFLATGLVTNASLANMANSTIKCRTTAGTGVPEDCTAQQVTNILNATQIAVTLSGVNFNSGNTDNTITLPSPPTGFTRYSFRATYIDGASASLNPATAAVFTAAAGGGVALTASGTAITVTATTDSTNNNMQVIGSVNANSMSNLYSALTSGNVFFRVQTASTVPATANVTIVLQWLP